MPIPAQQPAPLNPQIAQLFKAVGANQNNIVKKGSLITFNYQFWKHDPYPLCLVCDVNPPERLRCLNLHYYTFPKIKEVLRLGANNNMFSYANIKSDPYIVGAFRTYKWQGIRGVKILDASFLLSVMATVRSFDPTQVAAIRKAVQLQIKQATKQA